MIPRKQLPAMLADWEARIRTTHDEVAARGNDKYGVLTGNIANASLQVGVIGYALGGSVEEFRSWLIKGVLLRIELLRRYHSGVPLIYGGRRRPNDPPPDRAILKAEVSNANFTWMLSALAAARLDLAKELGKLLGAIPADLVADAYCHVLRDILLDNYDSLQAHMSNLRLATPARDDNEYYRMLAAIARSDSTEVQSLFSVLDQRHRHYINTDAMFVGGTANELLCIWGIGLGNLARFNNVIDHIDFGSDLIPVHLMI